MASRTEVSCGLDLYSVNDIANSLSTATNAGYQFVASPIVHPRLKREFIYGKAKNRQGAFTRSDLVLSSQDWNTLVVGKVSSSLDVDSELLTVRKNSEKALEQELNYAAHLGLPAILVSVKSANCVNLARCIHNRILSSVSYQGMFQVWVHVPMRSAKEESKIYFNLLNSNNDDSGGLTEDAEMYLEDTWNWWNIFRGVCNTEKKIGLALELSAELPSQAEIDRWLGEPLRCLIIPASIFLTNKKGYPVLSRAHQLIVQRSYKLDIQVLIKGVKQHSQIKHYHQYMEHLWLTQTPDDSLAQFSKGYEDYLQVPLQPLMDNLESCTYEIFEKDPIKYTEYQRAMYQAILDKVDETEKEHKTVILMVVGAGRGPLVRAALAAARNADRKIKVYAVEKNPNAVVTLQALQDEMWGESVTVVSCDMRYWNAPEKADILVSELLGSFGDNELSPECLDGVQKFLKDDGISIPCSYTSYIAPIQSAKLYSEVAQMREKDKHPLTPFEMPYVVRLHNRTELAEPQPLFSFHHPNYDPVIDNTRNGKRSFHIKQNSMLHGFAGYFETVLYKDIFLSIVPANHSPGMFSWFPIFFPLKDPVYLIADSTLEVHFWRCVSRSNVWYEWCLTKPYITPIHNPNGRSYTIAVREVLPTTPQADSLHLVTMLWLDKICKNYYWNTILWKIDDKPVKIDKWDGAAVKNALDDAVKKVFKEKFKYKENHRLMDGRLIFSTIAVAAAMFALLWDIFHPFPESQPILIFCVVSYFILMAVLTAYTTFLEQGIFLVSMEKDAAGIDPDHKWTARSCLKRFDDNYSLSLTYTDGKSKQTRESKLTKSVSSWFDENGMLLYDLFEPDVCKLHNDILSDKKQK